MKSNTPTDVIDAPELHEHTRSGRATFDDRGNTIWEWQTEPGIYSREVTAHQLQSLQANELTLVDQWPAYPSTYAHWKRQYQHNAKPARRREHEMIIPARPSAPDKGVGSFLDQLLEGKGLSD